MGAIVRLQWTRYPDGFELTDDRRRFAHVAGLGDVLDVKTKPGARFLVPRKPNRPQVYVLDGTDNRVFIDLANVQDDDASVLAFVDKWGLLKRPHAQYEVGRASPLVLAGLMREGIENLRLNPAGEGLPRWLLPNLQLRRTKLLGDSAPRIFLEPDSLFDFCCAEFLQLTEAGTEIRTCLRCGELFALGKVGKPPMYCSTACKQAMHRRRKREAELRASHDVRLRGPARR